MRGEVRVERAELAAVHELDLNRDGGGGQQMHEHDATQSEIRQRKQYREYLEIDEILWQRLAKEESSNVINGHAVRAVCACGKRSMRTMTASRQSGRRPS